MAKRLVANDVSTFVEPLLPLERPKPKDGRPRASGRATPTGIVFVLPTGIRWAYVPREMGACGMTRWRRLRDWPAAAVLVALHRVLLERLQGADKLNWGRASRDSASVPAKGGIGDRAEPDGSRQGGGSGTWSSMARARRLG